MNEIRLHGRGGQGVVKAAQCIVKAVVAKNGFAQFIPYFGVERKGSPVFGFLRIDNKPIRLKTQIYKPKILFIFDDSLLEIPNTCNGLVDGGTIIINTNKSIDSLKIPSNAGIIASVDATQIAMDGIGINIPNTAMLGAFCYATDIIDLDTILDVINDSFGEPNCKLAITAYKSTQILDLTGRRQ